MRRTIEDLFNGRIMPYDQQHVRTAKYLEAVGKMAELEERLLAALDDSDHEVWDAYQDAQADAMDERNLVNFVYGFRLCTRLILESLDDDGVETVMFE